MGNQQAIDQIGQQANTLKDTVPLQMTSNNSCWETIAMTPSLPAQWDFIKKKKKSFKDTPVPNRAKSTSKRWSQSRKIKCDGQVNKARKPLQILSEVKENVNLIYPLVDIEKDFETRINSTVCGGGVPLTAHHITGLSPIKLADSSTKEVTLVPLKSYILEHVGSIEETSSQKKVEMWLAITTEHALKGEFAEVEKKSFDRDLFQCEAVTNNDKLEEISPIASENVNNFEHETTFESLIVTDLNKKKTKKGLLQKNNNFEKGATDVKQGESQDGRDEVSKKKTKKRRKRIAMRSNALKVKETERTKRTTARLNGKHLPVLLSAEIKPDATLKDGDVALRVCKYNLRPKAGFRRECGKLCQEVHESKVSIASITSPVHQNNSCYKQLHEFSTTAGKPLVVSAEVIEERLSSPVVTGCNFDTVVNVISKSFDEMQEMVAGDDEKQSSETSSRDLVTAETPNCDNVDFSQKECGKYKLSRLRKRLNIEDYVIADESLSNNETCCLVSHSSDSRTFLFHNAEVVTTNIGEKQELSQTESCPSDCLFV